MNSSLKKYIRLLVPPILLNLEKQFFSPSVSWRGDYPKWADAVSGSEGYDSISILEKVKSANSMVISGEAVYERDSILFDEIQYSWPALAGLLKAAADDGGHLRVLDLGGALGSSYYQNRKFMEELKEVKWRIVEQENFVECGKQNFETDILKFFHSVEEAAKNCAFNVALLSSVLPYLERPYDMLARIIELGAETVIIDRTPVLPGNADRLTVQNIPGTIYHASYPAWFFFGRKIIEFHGQKIFHAG
jgi:putative methyltransferase (TIGR04325 family)